MIMLVSVSIIAARYGDYRAGERYLSTLCEELLAQNCGIWCFWSWGISQEHGVNAKIKSEGQT
jgi:hypothetical protein